MTTEQYNILAAKLEKRGYKKDYDETLKRFDWRFYKRFIQSPHGECQSAYVIIFAIYDWKKYDNPYIGAYGIEICIEVMRTSDEIINFRIPYNGESIDKIERQAASFYEWCEDNVELNTE